MFLRRVFVSVSPHRGSSLPPLCYCGSREGYYWFIYLWDMVANRNLSHIERDSRKDEAVVFIFIFATGGLLTWALLKPWIERYIEVRPYKNDQQEMAKRKEEAKQIHLKRFA